MFESCVQIETEPLLHHILGIEIIRTTPNQGGCGTRDVFNDPYSKLVTVYIRMHLWQIKKLHISESIRVSIRHYLFIDFQGSI